MSQSTYQQSFRVMSPDSTVDRRLRPSAALQYVQELSDRHSLEMGNGYHTLKAKNMALICAKTSLTVHRAPETGEVFHGETWLRAMKGTQWIRDSVLRGEDGTVLSEITTSWVLMDLLERRVLRPTKVEGLHIVTAPELALSHDRLKFQLPENLPCLGERKVCYSDIDYFGHLNNCVYVDILCDAVPTPLVGRQIKTFDIQYCNEASLGDVLTLYGAEQDGTFYLTGSHARGKCFDAVATIEAL